MGEVKSTMDLIMEKTRGMNLTSDERDQARKEKIKREAHLLVLPYLKGETSLSRFMKSLSEETLIPALEVLAESLRIDANNSRALDGLRALCGQAKALTSLVDDIQFILEEYAARRREARGLIGYELLQELAREGISGPAVKPAVDDSPEWLEQRKGLEENYGPRLKDAVGRLFTTWKKMRSESSRSSDG